MELRLAEYNLETGKFERFLELGRDFAYAGYGIIVKNKKPLIDGSILDTWPYIWREAEDEGFFDKDEKDPLNRFNGLFDGRTYGNGRFILERKIKNERHYAYCYVPDIWEFDVLHYKKTLFEKSLDKRVLETFSKTDYIPERFEQGTKTVLGKFFNRVDFKDDILFHKNLHKNPELWEKIK